MPNEISFPFETKERKPFGKKNLMMEMRQQQLADELNDQKILMRMMICSRTKIYQKVFVGTHFLILIFDFKLKGLSKMTDRFCEGKKIHHQQQQQHHYHYWYLICWSNKTENPFNQKRREDQALKKLKLLWVIGFERGCSFKRVQSQQCSV